MVKINTIIQGNCLEELKKLDSESVDCVITDPPYNISKEGGDINRSTLTNKSVKRWSNIKMDFGDWDKRTEVEFNLFTEEWFKELARVMKPKAWAYVFFAKEKIGLIETLIKKYNLKYRCVFCWCKSNPVPSFRKVNWLSATEFCVVFSKGEGKIKKFLNQKEMFNYMIIPNKSIYGKTSHPTEKPEILIEKFVLTNSNEGDLVLDCFMGSGTTAIACLKHNRNFIGIEMNPEYIKIAENRLKPYLEQTQLTSLYPNSNTLNISEPKDLRYNSSYTQQEKNGKII